MNESKRFDIILHWDKQQNLYIAEATDFPGVGGKGTTHEEALAAVKDAIRWHLEAPTEAIPPTP